MRLYAIDIETDTRDGDGLDPMNPSTRITSVAVCTGNYESSELEGVIVFDDPCEERLLRTLNGWLNDPRSEPGVLVTWNGANFDLPFLMIRAQMCAVGINLTGKASIARPSKYPPHPSTGPGRVVMWGPHDHADIMYAYQDPALNAGSWRLKSTARAHGLDPIEVDASRMEDLTVAQRVAYNLSDVEITFLLACKVPRLMEYADSRVLTSLS